MRSAITKSLLLTFLVAVALGNAPSVRAATDAVVPYTGSSTAPFSNEGGIKREKPSMEPLPDLSHLEKLAAQKDVFDPAFKSVWSDAAFRRAVLILIGDARFKVLTGEWSEKGPVQRELLKQDGVYVTMAAKPHDAGNNSLFVFVNLGDKRKDPAANTLQACWRRAVPGAGVEVYWLATGQEPRRLPSSACSQMAGDAMLKAYGRGTLGPWPGQVLQSFPAQAN